MVETPACAHRYRCVRYQDTRLRVLQVHTGSTRAIFKTLKSTPSVGLYKKKYDAAHVNSVYNFSRENDIISMTASATAAVVLLSITICSFAYSN